MMVAEKGSPSSSSPPRQGRPAFLFFPVAGLLLAHLGPLLLLESPRAVRSGWGWSAAPPRPNPRPSPTPAPDPSSYNLHGAETPAEADKRRREEAQRRNGADPVEEAAADTAARHHGRPGIFCFMEHEIFVAALMMLVSAQLVRIRGV